MILPSLYHLEKKSKSISRMYIIPKPTYEHELFISSHRYTPDKSGCPVIQNRGEKKAD